MVPSAIFATVTGGQTCGEIWSPPHELGERLGPRTQEHCVVYNMIRLAEYLLRWTGDARYADYWERNLYNGILAQQNHQDGRIAYFLGTSPGAHKAWGTPTETFWCCHGTLVQAHVRHNRGVYFADQDGPVVTQYLPSELQAQVGKTGVIIRLDEDAQSDKAHRPDSMIVDLTVQCQAPAPFGLKLRLPWWLAGKAKLSVNGHAARVAGNLGKPSSYVSIVRKWQNDNVRLELPRALTACPLPGREDLVAFMYGPIVLAGLVNEQRTLRGNARDPATILRPFTEREWGNWRPVWQTRGQRRDFEFIPLHEVTDEKYTLYFPVTRTPR